MTYIVKGIENKKGVITRDGESVEYDNLVLHCVSSSNNPMLKMGLLCGSRVVTTEVKVKNDQQEFDKLVYVGEFKGVVCNFNDLLNCEIDFAVNTDKKLVGLSVISIDAAA